MVDMLKLTNINKTFITLTIAPNVGILFTTNKIVLKAVIDADSADFIEFKLFDIFLNWTIFEFNDCILLLYVCFNSLAVCVPPFLG